MGKGPNRSTAVMQRRVEAHDSLDYFPTPPWATRALCEWLAERDPIKHQTVWEPACGEGHMVRPLREYFADVLPTDVQAYAQVHGGGHALEDFTVPKDHVPVDWVITNPPFALAEQFIDRARLVARVGFAMLVRTSFLEGGDRYRHLFRHFNPDFVLQFSERVLMLKGRLIRTGAIDPFSDPPGKKASTATSFCWLVWYRAPAHLPVDTVLRWIPPCREQLEREGDYPDYSAEIAALQMVQDAPGGLLEGAK